LHRCIGKGGFGEVYLAEMSTTSGFVKTVAVKVLREDVREHEQVASRLRDEARLLGLLRHPAIVQAADLITLAGRPAVVMEYVPGVNLTWLINPKRCKERMPPTVVLAIVRQVASALDAAYARPSVVTGEPLRVLHRDIKPGNVRITSDGEVKVLDFGIARSEHSEREAETQNHQLGSLRYMAPEMMSGGGASPASDVYALGVVLYESLSRMRLGWAGESEDGHRLQVQARIEEADLTAFTGESWNRVVELVERMLDYQPDRRPTAQEVTEICRALERMVDGPALEEWTRAVLPTVVAPDEPRDADLSGQTLFEDASTVTAIVTEELELELDPTEEQDPEALVAGRAPVVFAVVAGVVLLLVAGLGAGWWFLLGPGAQPAPPEPVVELAPVEPAPPAEPAPPSVEEPEPAGDGVAELEDPGRPEPSEPVSTGEPAPSTEPGSPAAEPPPPTAHAAPAPTPAAEPPAAAAGEPVKVRFGSLPFGLQVFLDGSLVGKTPLTMEVPAGSHVLMFVDGERTQRQNIEVAPGGKSIWTYNSTRGDVQ